MGGISMESGGAPAGSTWRPFGTVLCLLALVALVLVPATLDAPVAATPAAVADGATTPDAPTAATAPAASSDGQVPDPPPVSSSPLEVPALSGGTPASGPGPSVPPATAPADDVSVPPAPGPVHDADPGPADDGGGEEEGSPLVTLAEAIPVPPDLPVPEIPEPAQPFTDSVAPAMFVVCSFAALPGGLSGVAIGLAGGSVPGLSELVGALLLYQVPILDLCVLFGYPDELVECSLDDQVREQVPQAVPVDPPAPVGTMLGVTRGVEGSLAGDTSASDQFLASIGCEARPS